MTCVHLRKLMQLCEEENIRLASSDLIHVVCQQCGVQEVCPAVLTDEYDALERRFVPESSLIAPVPSVKS